jgi:(E)-4-hydroxy-3-methylbut-2-enyl-diphosphate synthase
MQPVAHLLLHLFPTVSTYLKLYLHGKDNISFDTKQRLLCFVSKETWTHLYLPPEIANIVLQNMKTRAVHIGDVVIGGGQPVVVQTMTDTDTNDVEATVAQIGRVREAGGRIVRLAVQGMREAESFGRVACKVRRRWSDVALVADVHFLPEVALAVAEHADKVRINPGNYNDGGGDFDLLLEKCAAWDVAIRVGVNHGSLSPRIVERWGDTPAGMTASAMEFLRRCLEKNFGNVVVSMKSSNTRVMVHACRMLVAAMRDEDMDYPLHLGVTEAGSGIEGRIKSAVGIGALLTDGIGDTIRVSLTEPPENEIPVGQMLAGHFTGDFRSGELPVSYERRPTDVVGRLGGVNIPLLYSELNEYEREALAAGRIALLSATGDNPVAEWRARLAAIDDRRPAILHRHYATSDPVELAIKSAAGFGPMFLDGLADGIWIEAPKVEQTDEIALHILQAARARISRAEFIACPGCGRTLFALRQALEEVKARLSHLTGLKIAVMGCIVNGPGEMADADYGYVGAGPGRITLYRNRTPVLRNIPQEKALDHLVELLRNDGHPVDFLSSPLFEKSGTKNF